MHVVVDDGVNCEQNGYLLAQSLLGRPMNPSLPAWDHIVTFRYTISLVSPVSWHTTKKKHNKDRVMYQRVVHESVAHIAASSSKSNANVEMRQRTSSDSMYNLLKWMGKEKGCRGNGK